MSWRQLPPIAKFSVIAFVIALLLALFSMGAEGIGIYFAVEFALPVSIESIQGDAAWPSMILAGMAWSLGFLMAGWVCQRIHANKFAVWSVFVLILWVWAYLVWWAIISWKVVQ